jgi:hypothetical protein
MPNAQHGPVGYGFVPFTVETPGRLGKPFMSLLSQLRDLAVLRSNALFTKA